MFRYVCLILLWVSASSFVQQQQQQQQHAASRVLATKHRRSLSSSSSSSSSSFDDLGVPEEIPRREILTGLGTVVTAFLVGGPATATAARADEGETESFAAIAARANQIKKELDKENAQAAANVRKSEKTAYDFELPVEGSPVKFSDIIKQEFYDDGVKVKAILVVNIKQDDPIARKTIPELISLATKYGRNRDGALAVVACPTYVVAIAHLTTLLGMTTVSPPLLLILFSSAFIKHSDQGYYEPDTSTLIRLKLASEYGYGINPATSITDKVNLLGTGAVPFWRWLQSTCRTPAGLGRIEGNFEKFLIDGRTGLPVRRYPRRYAPLNMSDDIEAVISGRPLPPARANYLEEWRQAAAEAERDTYRFQKGVNVFDQ